MSRTRKSSRDLSRKSSSTSSYSQHQPDSDDDQPTVVFRASLHNTIFDVMRNRPGWQETDSDTDWDFNWADVGWVREYFDHTHLEEHQRINHFRNHYELTRKDLLVKNLKRMKRQLERTDTHAEASKYSFFPATFVLPAEYGLFVEEFKRTPGVTWIMKPVGRAQGKGIFLFNRLSQVSDWKKDYKWKSDQPQADSYVAQRYIESPLLVGGRKFDMRLYVLVTSYSPLKAWVHRGGFCRFTAAQYDKEGLSDLNNLFVHLTNNAIQKTADTYNKACDLKWPMRQLKMYMISKYGKKRVEESFYEIQMVMIRALLAVQKTMIQDKHCFELYGYDIILDSELNSWLLEVNASPSLSASNDDDYSLKYGMLDDMLNIVDLEGNRTGDETSIGGFDLVWDNGPVNRTKNSSSNAENTGSNKYNSGGPANRSKTGALRLSRTGTGVALSHQMNQGQQTSLLGSRVQACQPPPTKKPVKKSKR
jgi:tubulin polyglutamylase TTLL9